MPSMTWSLSACINIMVPLGGIDLGVGLGHGSREARDFSSDSMEMVSSWASTVRLR